MRTFTKHTAMGGLLLALTVLPGLAAAGQLVMKNGDVITGNITKIEDSEVFIEPAYADEFSVKLDEVVSIESDEILEVELEDGSTLDARFASGSEGQQVLIVDEQPVTVNMADLAAAAEPQDWYERDSRVDVNMTLNDGNTDSTNSLIFADTRLKLGDHRHLAELTLRRDETDGDRTKEQDLFRYSYNWLFNDPWYVGATGDFERDPIRDLDHRYTVGALVGRDIFDDSRKFLTISLGAGFSEEKISGVAESGASGLWNLRYEHDFRNGDLTLFHDQNLNYQFYGVNNAILKTNTGFRFDIVSDVYTSVSLRYDYETDPAEGAEKADTTLAIGVGAEF